MKNCPKCKSNNIVNNNEPMVMDCFIFFNELDILEIRLNTLNSVVDKFVIVEATTSHRGNPKPLYFEENKERFKEFLHKIIHIVVDLPNIPGDAWANERHHRDCIMQGLIDCKDDDIIILGDADEIANPEAIKNYNNTMGLCKFEQYLFYYYLDCRCTTEKWTWLKVLPYGMLKNMTPCEVRYPPSEGMPMIKDGGWHFSCMGGVDQLITKIKNFAHVELDTDEYLGDRERIQNKINNGEDVFNRDHLKFDYTFLDSTFPQYILDNYEQLIERGFIKGFNNTIETQIRYGNNYERAAIGREDIIGQREHHRYTWASKNIVGTNILELGCSTGYGLRMLPKGIKYKGIDYDPTIIEFAKSQFGDLGEFECADINSYDLGYYDTIIAFEFIEHLDNGLELVEKLKKHCKCLLITVPYNEVPGYWGPHHRLHNLTEEHFEGFSCTWLVEYDVGPKDVDFPVEGQLMAMKWVNIEERVEVEEMLEHVKENNTKNKNADNQIDVSVCISTKNRYNELPLTLASIAQQSVLPREVVIFDDNDEPQDLRENNIYKNIFAMLMDKGVQWTVQFGKKMGQVHNHQTAIEVAKYPFIFRCDDDHVLEPNVIETLYDTISSNNKIGAVGGLVYHPGRINNVSSIASNKLSEIFLGCNLQWYKGHKERLIEVEHLYSTFMFRKEAAGHGYCLELSKVGHREESLLTGQMFINGWRLYINTETITWHFQGDGGIRSYKDPSMYQHDEEIFARKMREWNINPTKYKFIVLDAGLGDHLALLKVLPEIIEKYYDHKIILAVCYPESIETFTTKEQYNILKIISISDAINMGINMDEFNIYKKMWDWNWQKPMEDAYRRMYLDG